MISTFSFSYPWWYLIFCLILGIGYAFLMYYRDTRFAEYNIWFKRALAILRACSVFLISLLLLSPFVKTTKEDIKTPLIVIASDRSESIASTESKENQSLYNQKIQELSAALGDKFEVKKLSFGSDVHATYKDNLTDKSSNLNQVFKYISENFGDQNLGAVILGTDGIYNEGSNPLYSNHGINAPLYTIALGDTVQRKDLLFQNILHNKIAYLGDKFPVQVDISSYNGAGATSKLVLEMISGGITKGSVKKPSISTVIIFLPPKTSLLMQIRVAS